MTLATAAAYQAADPAATGKTQLSRNKLGETYDNFLKLLTTQLQYQDPMAPMDSAQFTNQLVLYSQVEQQISQNERLDKLIAMEKVSQTQASLGFIGMEVEAEGDRFAFKGEPVSLGYTLPTTAKVAKLRIVDANGKAVQEFDAKTAAGTHEVAWNGRMKDGRTAEAGTYRIEVLASDAEGRAIEAATTVTGRVSRVETTDGNPTVMMSGVPVALDRIRSANQPAMQNAWQTQASLSLIGLDVEAETRSIPYSGAPVKLGYTLPEAATEAAVRILDSQGRVVRTLSGATAAGTHSLTWDGTGNDGQSLRDGLYTVEVVAKNAQQAPVAATATLFGKVTGIQSGGGQTSVLIGDLPIPLENIRSARAA